VPNEGSRGSHREDEIHSSAYGTDVMSNPVGVRTR
jgi:hypothetical protein